MHHRDRVRLIREVSPIMDEMIHAFDDQES
jgi:hypothetical protein